MADRKFLHKIMHAAGIALTSVISVILIILFIQIASGRETEIFGYRFYVVMTDSMSPELEPGDVILSKSVNPENIRVGDNVTFLGTEGSQKGLLITHKVITAPYFEEDGGYIVTQGVKENSPVDAPVAFENVRAVMLKKLPVLTVIYSLIRRPLGFFIVIILPLVLIMLYQLYRIAAYKAETCRIKKEKNGSA